MEITSKAVEVLNNLLIEKGRRCLILNLVSSGCSKKIKLELSDDTDFQVLNGLNIKIDEEAIDAVTEMIIDYEDGALKLINECASGCSCD